jgi:hypothetical protein
MRRNDRVNLCKFINHHLPYLPSFLHRLTAQTAARDEHKFLRVDNHHMIDRRHTADVLVASVAVGTI